MCSISFGSPIGQPLLKIVVSSSSQEIILPLHHKSSNNLYQITLIISSAHIVTTNLEIRWSTPPAEAIRRIRSFWKVAFDPELFNYNSRVHTAIHLAFSLFLFLATLTLFVLLFSFVVRIVVHATGN